MIRIYLLKLGIILSYFTYSQNILTQVDSIKIDGASIWGGISYDGHRINVTTMSGGQINLVKFDSSLTQTGSMIPITSASDVPSGTSITDHKHIFINDHIYITFSNTGDEDLFLFKIDTNGTRIGDLDTLAWQFSGAPTNDMILTTDSNSLSILHFYPSSQSWVYQYDFDLNKQWGPVATSATLPHNNIGNAIFNKNMFNLFTGDMFGTNASVILTQWNADWTPAATSSQTIIASSGGDGKWFSTGISPDKENERLYIGYQHIYSGQNLGEEHIDISVLDKNLNVEETQHVTASGYYRPHFLLLDAYLYMVYDLVGGVYIKKYKVEKNTSALTDETQKEDYKIDIYPNPSIQEINIQLKNTFVLGYEIHNSLGNHIKVASFSGHETSFQINGLPSGIYSIKINTTKGFTYSKIIIL